MASGPIISWQINGEILETVADFIFLGSKITADGDCSHEIKRHLLLGRKVNTNLDSILKSRDITLPAKVHLGKAVVFSSSHVWMWELDYKESWAPKNWFFWTVVLEKTLESPLDCKAIQPVHPKGYQSWVFIGRTDAEAETPVLWPPDIKSWLIAKDPDAWKDWGQEEKGMTENVMADGITDSMDMGLGGFQELVMEREAGMLWFTGLQSWTQLSNWTELNNEWCWVAFHVFVSHLYVFFGEMSVLVIFPLFDWVVFFFFSGIELYELLVYFGNKSCVSYFICYYFLPFWRLPFHFPVSP